VNLEAEEAVREDGTAAQTRNGERSDSFQALGFCLALGPAKSVPLESGSYHILKRVNRHRSGETEQTGPGSWYTALEID
jgi:hypothetical protein